MEDQSAAQDATTETPDVPEESSKEARTYSESEVAKLKREAQKLRRERNEYANTVQKLTSEQEAAAQKRAEEQGEYQALYQKEQASHQAYRANMEGRLLNLRLQQIAVSKGVPQTQAGSIAYPTEGLSLSDDLKSVEGDVDGIMDAFLAPFIVKSEESAKPAPRPPVVIGERPNSQKPEPLKGAKGLAHEYARALEGKI